MRPDVIDLQQFYASPLGQLTRQYLGRRIRLVWPDLRGLRLGGLGFATPYLRAFREETERVLAFMPAQQGVLHWPPEGPILTALVEEESLPLPEASLDRILLVHGLENSEAVGALLREIWRVLAPGGRVLVITPNRRGLWARSEGTPFGHGHPYTGSQLTRLLREHRFLPTNAQASLFLPPSHRRLLLRMAGAFERLGPQYTLRFGGVLMVEAGKQIYALPTRRVEKVAPRLPGFGLRPQPI